MEPLTLKTAGFQHDCLQGKKLPGSLALKNQVFISPENFELLKGHAISINAIPMNEPNYANLYGVPLNLKDAEKYTDFFLQLSNVIFSFAFVLRPNRFYFKSSNA